MRNIYKLAMVCILLMCTAMQCNHYLFYVYNESERMIAVVVRDEPMSETGEITGIGFCNLVYVDPYETQAVEDLDYCNGREDANVFYIYVYQVCGDKYELGDSPLVEYRYTEAELKRIGRRITYKEEQEHD